MFVFKNCCFKYLFFLSTDYNAAPDEINHLSNWGLYPSSSSPQSPSAVASFLQKQLEVRLCEETP